MHSHSFLLNIVATPTPHIAMGNVTLPSRRLWCLVLNARSRFLDRYYNIVRTEIWIRWWKSWWSVEMKIHLSVSSYSQHFLPFSSSRYSWTVFLISRLCGLLFVWTLLFGLSLQYRGCRILSKRCVKVPQVLCLLNCQNSPIFLLTLQQCSVICNLGPDRCTKMYFWKFQKINPRFGCLKFAQTL